MNFLRPTIALAVEGRTVDYISEATGLTKHTVRNYLTRARIRGLLPYHRFDVDLIAEVAYGVLATNGPMAGGELRWRVEDIWGPLSERKFYRALVLAREAGIIDRSGGGQGCYSRYFCSSKATVRKLTDARKSRRANALIARAASQKRRRA